jgi:hypothetical protein
LQALLAYFNVATKGSGTSLWTRLEAADTQLPWFIDSADFKPVFIAGGQLGLDKNATKGGGKQALAPSSQTLN